MEHRVALFEEGVEVIRQCWTGEPLLLQGARTTRWTTCRSARGRSSSRRRRCGSAAASRRPRAGPAASPTPSWARPAPVWRTRGASTDAYTQAAREAGRPTTGRSHARRVGGRDAGGGRGGVRAGGDGRLPLLLAEPPGRVPRRSRPTRSSRCRTWPPIASSWAIRRRACASSGAGRRPPAPATVLLRLRHAHSGGPPHDKIMDAIRLFGDRVLPYCA